MEMGEAILRKYLSSTKDSVSTIQAKLRLSDDELSLLIPYHKKDFLRGISYERLQEIIKLVEQ